MSRLIEYNGGNSLTPSIDNWEDLVLTGKGRAYGAEFSFAYTDKKTSAELAYTLSWSERKFPNLNRDNWYPANFDNRHKLNITARHKFTPKIELYAGWTFHTGYRATVATQKVEKPVVLPGGGIRPDLEWVYEKPNIAALSPPRRRNKCPPNHQAGIRAYLECQYLQHLLPDESSLCRNNPERRDRFYR